MAAHYIVLAANRTVDVRSPTLVEDVVEVHVRTKPSGATFTRAVPYKSWLHKGAAGTIAIIAEHIEHVFSVRPSVIDANAVQQVDGSGLLSNAVEFIVEIDPPSDDQPGPFQGTVTIPVQVLHDQDTYDAYFEPVIAALHATAGY